LNCSQKTISLIDPLPYVFTNIEALILSRNQLTSLEGLAQFQKLKILDISYNQLKDLNEFLYLRDLKSLEVLICEGNPININKNAIFEETIIAIIANLRLLNNRVFNFYIYFNEII